MSKAINNREYWLSNQPRNIQEFRNGFFFVFAEILVVFQLVSYYSFLSTVGVIK
jgi:hypothetical protein